MAEQIPKSCTTQICAACNMGPCPNRTAQRNPLLEALNAIEYETNPFTHRDGNGHWAAWKIAIAAIKAAKSIDNN